MRQYSYHRDVRAGCEQCGKRWDAPNAQGVAARHHDATGHKTWVEVEMHITYGGSLAARRRKGR